MIIRLSEVPATGKNYTGEEPPELIDVMDDINGRVLSPIAYRIHAVRVPGSLIVSGQLTARMGLHCARCDKPFDRDMRESIDRAWELTPDGLQWLSPMDDIAVEVEEIDAKRGELPKIPRGEARDCVDLTDDIREATILAFSGYPLCKSDCKGLCPRCGVNLNEAACRCKPQQDNRWAILDRLDGQ